MAYAYTAVYIGNIKIYKKRFKIDAGNQKKTDTTGRLKRFAEEKSTSGCEVCYKHSQHLPKTGGLFKQLQWFG